MTQSLTEKFIFVSRNEDEVSKVFSRKIVQFHERFSDCLILAGLGVENESLESMNMEKSPDFDEAYFEERIISYFRSTDDFQSVDFKIKRFRTRFFITGTIDKVSPDHVLSRYNVKTALKIKTSLLYII